MGLQKVKAEMRGDTSRWCTRIEAKTAAKKIRRRDAVASISEFEEPQRTSALLEELEGASGEESCTE